MVWELGECCQWLLFFSNHSQYPVYISDIRKIDIPYIYCREYHIPYNRCREYLSRIWPHWRGVIWMRSSHVAMRWFWTPHNWIWPYPRRGIWASPMCWEGGLDTPHRWCLLGSDIQLVCGPPVKLKILSISIFNFQCFFKGCFQPPCILLCVSSPPVF